VSQNMTRWQAAILGIVVLASVAVGGVGLVAVAARQGVWAETFEVSVGFPDANDIKPGTPVRIRGVEAGQVVGVEYPDRDGPDATVTVRLRLDAKFRGRLFADGSAQVQANGMLGSKVVAVNPGSPAAGPLPAGGSLRASKSLDMAATAEKLAAVADEAEKLLKDIRSGNGTLGKLVQDDSLYDDLKGLAGEARGIAKRAEAAVGKVEEEMAGVRGFVADGRETLRSVKQGTDAMQRLPLVRSYVEDATALLVRPTCRREARAYNTADLFEPGTAIISASGRYHLSKVAEWLKGVPHDKAEVVVAALCDPNDRSQTTASAGELTRKQAEAVVEFLKDSGAHKMGWWSRRKMTAIGLGTGPSPVVERDPLPPSYLQVLLFTPQ
jgi:phospholipid/cholesterol/gamma-HCH transport system substrate-binding protein